MPLYEYECEACGQRFEIIRRFSDPPADTCRVCGKGPVRRLISSPAIQFKGTGWYITDYGQKGKTSESSSDATSKTESKEKSESKDTASTPASTASESTKPAAAPSTTPSKSD